MWCRLNNARKYALIGSAIGLSAGAALGGAAYGIAWGMIRGKFLNQQICELSKKMSCRFADAGNYGCDYWPDTPCPGGLPRSGPVWDSISDPAGAKAHSVLSPYLPLMSVTCFVGMVSGGLIGFCCAKPSINENQPAPNAVPMVDIPLVEAVINEQPVQGPANQPIERIINVQPNAEVLTLQKRLERTNWKDEIPDRYQDPCTFELMDTPMLINSGKTYDLSTLNRIQGEVKRCPLTRDIITEQVLNEPLQQEIRQFVVGIEQSIESKEEVSPGEIKSQIPSSPRVSGLSVFANQNVNNYVAIRIDLPQSSPSP